LTKKILLIIIVLGDIVKILKIKKMSNNKYKITLDNTEIITFDNVILEYNLLYKKDLSTDEIKIINSKTNYYDAYNKSLKYVTKKVRSKKEVEKYLDSFDISNNEKREILDKLTNLNLINDKLYCKAFINDKINISKYGVGKIEKLLKEKGISYDIIQNELSNIDYDIVNSNLESKIKRKIQNNSKYTNFELRQRLIIQFTNEGYSKEKINEYIDKYIDNDDEIIKIQFDKLYYKYKNKYGEKLFLIKLKQKLYQKGFSNEVINKLMQEKTEE